MLDIVIVSCAITGNASAYTAFDASPVIHKIAVPAIGGHSFVGILAVDQETNTAYAGDGKVLLVINSATNTLTKTIPLASGVNHPGFGAHLYKREGWNHAN